MAADPDPIAFSNSIRLSVPQWLGAALVAILLILFGPSLWKHRESFALEPDYRMPRDLGYDYWLYERFVELAANQYDTLLLGDSVVWGEYTTRQETLSHYLNQRSGREQYANLGLDGAHPLALSGLVEHYAGGIAGKNVILHCNCLWMSSAKADLETDSGDVNHPRLVPQFSPSIPAYKEEVSPRLGILIEQRLAFNKWTNHLQQVYYEGTDIPAWTIKHPYENPFQPFTRGLPPSDNARAHQPLAWDKNDSTKRDFPWVDLETSLQWPAFQRVVEVLRQRDNKVFVVVGPFNEHMLTAASLERYQRVKVAIASWLHAQQVPYLMPPPLPSQLYGDASHPLAAGYDMLAREILEAPAFFSASGKAK
jgi:hypothetical protein